jgi:hypothetical protein
VQESIERAYYNIGMSRLSSSNVPAGPTCLFTGVALAAGTHEEHTIPRALGGRIRSRIVSSNEFNNDCGSAVDPFLIRLYAETICHLGPLMNAEHQPGNLVVEIPGAPYRFVIDGEGSLTIQGIAVVERDDAGRPRAAMGADAAAVRRWAQRNAPPGRVQRTSFVPATTEREFFRNRLVIGPVIEVAAMKSAMLSFDHLLANDPGRRFIRHDSLAPARQFIRDAVTTMEYDGEDVHRFSLGIQYEKLELLQRLRDRAGGETQAFEHVLIASGNNATRTLDCVFWVAGIDPFGFRLSSDWRDGDFLCTIVNGLLRNGSVIGPVWGNLPESICQPTNRRSFPSHPNEAVMENAMAEMAVHRADGFRRAIDLVERQLPDLVQRRLITMAELGLDGDHTIGAAIRERFSRLYQRRIGTSDGRRDFETAVTGASAALQASGVLATQFAADAPAPAIDWHPILAAYYDGLNRLCQRFGLPGEMFVNESIIEANVAGLGRLDDHPLSI